MQRQSKRQRRVPGGGACRGASTRCDAHTVCCGACDDSSAARCCSCRVYCSGDGPLNDREPRLGRPRLSRCDSWCDTAARCARISCRSPDGSPEDAANVTEPKPLPGRPGEIEVAARPRRRATVNDPHGDPAVCPRVQDPNLRTARQGAVSDAELRRYRRVRHARASKRAAGISGRIPGRLGRAPRYGIVAISGFRDQQDRHNDGQGWE